jgi:hypothetical protein
MARRVGIDLVVARSISLLRTDDGAGAQGVLADRIRRVLAAHARPAIDWPSQVRAELWP